MQEGLEKSFKDISQMYKGTFAASKKVASARRMFGDQWALDGVTKEDGIRQARAKTQVGAEED